MRLLYLSADPGVPVLGGKGASVHLRAMVSAFTANGADVIVASPRIEAGENELPASVQLESIPAVKPRECRTASELLDQAEHQAHAVQALARRERAQAIYERYSLASFAGARAGAAMSIPLVLEVNAPLREETRRFRELVHEPFAIEAERETFAAAQRIFAVSAALAGWLAEQGVDRERVEVMGNAPPARRFAPKPPLDAHQQVVVGFAGGLKRWHGIETLVRAFEQVVDAGAGMRLEVVGQGPMDQALAAGSLPPERLTRIGQLAHHQALDRLERWDVGVAPYSELEGFYFSPLKLYEYMAAGLCPVVSDVGELASIVRHGQTGLVVPADDPEALRQALLDLDRDRDRLRELGANAREAATRMPSWDESARRALAAIGPAAVAVAEGGGRW